MSLENRQSKYSGESDVMAFQNRLGLGPKVSVFFDPSWNFKPKNSEVKANAFNNFFF